MCGIIGYTGYDEATGVLVKGLKTLEYRGYDSSGIAVYNHNFKECLVTKCTGRVANLEKRVGVVDGNTGIGHTRWATHGNVSDANSHPHKFGSVTLVHNGIIENYESLKHTLGVEKKLKSQTDSEIVAALIDKDYDGNPIESIISAVKKLRGTYGLAIMFDDCPDTIYAVRNVSPIVCCQNENGSYIASDIMAIGEYSESYFVLPELAVAEITKQNIKIVDFKGNIIDPEFHTIDGDIRNSGKGAYPFYMEKEIMEQTEALNRMIHSRLKGCYPDFSAENIDDTIFEKCSNISIIACGTAMHAGLIGKYLVEKICRIPVNVYMASEYM